MSAVPAWKRLGLKLKGSAGDSPAAAPSTTSTPSVTRQPAPATSALKRKLPSQQQSFNNQNTYPTQNKRFRSDTTPAAQRKSVSFSQETKTTSTTDAAAKEKKREKKKAKKAKQASKKSAQQSKNSTKADTNLEPSLAYLRQWHSARDQWKFNKNHQTLLIKYVFESDKIPSADVPVFYQYIRDLKGFVRTRLREQAQEIKKTDMEAGASVFPGGDKAKEKNEERQKQYEDAIARFLEDQKERSQEKSKKRSFDEVEFVLRIAPGGSGKKEKKKETKDKEDGGVDKAVKERLIKRIRAEMVLEELADSEDATSTATTTSTSASTSTAAAAVPAPQPQTARASTDGQQPAKRRRLRNKRTDISDSESSDSSDSDSSDSDSDSDEEMADAGVKTATTSTSSSSSSSSEAESSESENEKSEESDSSDSSDNDSD